MRVNIRKYVESFVFVENTVHLGAGYMRWLENSLTVNAFLNYLNDFYAETNFGAFFQKHYDYFAEHSKRFRVEIYNQINFEWFRQHGLNQDNMHIVLSSVGCRLGTFAVRQCENLDERIVYAAVPTSDNYSDLENNYLLFAIHEFVHAFANPIADTWLIENDEFRSWATASYNAGNIYIAYHV